MHRADGAPQRLLQAPPHDARCTRGCTSPAALAWEQGPPPTNEPWCALPPRRWSQLDAWPFAGLYSAWGGLLFWVVLERAWQYWVALKIGLGVAVVLHVSADGPGPGALG